MTTEPGVATPNAAVPSRRRLLLAGLALLPVVGLGALIGSQYVETRWYSLVVPGFVALGCAQVGCLAAGGRSRPVAVLATAAALAATAAAFVLTQLSPVTPLGRALPPYGVAAAVAWLWAAPPRR